jgi:hypothetical protein
MLRVDGQSARTCGLLLPTNASVIENAQYRLSALFVPAEFVPIRGHGLAARGVCVAIDQNRNFAAS